MKEAANRRRWTLRFVRNVVLWLIPVTIAWVLLTPYYNRFLVKAGENLTRMTESPSTTRLQAQGRHHLLITRSDMPASRGSLSSVRVTDTHFPLLLLVSFFLAVPGVPWPRRLENLGWALLIAVFFHIVSLLFWVKFVYATQLGEWSAQHYGSFAQNFWGLGKHLIDLPFKLALPLALWAAFYLRELLPQEGDIEASGRG